MKLRVKYAPCLRRRPKGSVSGLITPPLYIFGETIRAVHVIQRVVPPFWEDGVEVVTLASRRHASVASCWFGHQPPNG